MSKDSSVKYYQKNDERVQKRASERKKSLFKEEERKKNETMDTNNIKIFLNMINKI